MNILLITYQGDIAGSTNSISYLAKGLAEKGHNIYVGCRKESLLYSLLSDTKVNLVPMTFAGRFDMTNIRQIRDCVKKYNIQIVNAQSSWDRYTTVFASWIYGLKVKVFHTRRQTAKSIGGFLQNLIYVRGTDKIIAVSNGVKQELVKKGVDANHITVIYNGTVKEKYLYFDPAKIENLRAKYRINYGDIVIGSISRLKEQIQILMALQYVQFPVKVIFVGIEQTPQLKEIEEELNGKHQIFYTGIIPNKEAIYYLHLFNLKILASTIEGLSQSLLEAMAMGVPVIATAAAGNLDLIKNEENGLLFEDKNIQQLAEQIVKITSDGTLANKLSQNGKVTALHDFSIEKTIGNYEAFFQKSLI